MDRPHPVGKSIKIARTLPAFGLRSAGAGFLPFAAVPRYARASTMGAPDRRGASMARLEASY